MLGQHLELGDTHKREFSLSNFTRPVPELFLSNWQIVVKSSDSPRTFRSMELPFTMDSFKLIGK